MKSTRRILLHSTAFTLQPVNELAGGSPRRHPETSDHHGEKQKQAKLVINWWVTIKPVSITAFAEILVPAPSVTDNRGEVWVTRLPAEHGSGSG